MLATAVYLYPSAVKPVPDMTWNVFGEMLNLTQPNPTVFRGVGCQPRGKL